MKLALLSVSFFLIYIHCYKTGTIMRLRVRLLMLTVVTVIVSGCATPPPSNQSNLCSIFRQYPDWYEDAVAMQHKFD